MIGLVLSLLSLPGFAQVQDSQNWRKQLSSGATLGTVRRLFLGQRVIVVGPVVDLGGSVLLEWETAHKESSDRYSKFLPEHVSSAYKGKLATVVAVQLNELKRRERQPNALGEVVAEDDIPNPYFDIVVQLDDGPLAMCAEYPRTLSADIELASEASALSEQISKQLPLLVGKTVYAVGYSELYQPDTTLEEMAGIGSKGLLKRLSLRDVPLPEPLTILVAKYIDSTGVVFKVKLSGGKEALSFTELYLFTEMYYLESDSDKPFFARVVGSLLTEIPKNLTQREVDAIRRGSIYKGMRKDALFYLMWLSKKENNWGNGGKQLVYNSGRLIVYLDNDEKVEDWQSFDQQ